jgi:hypothetical protein
MTTTISITLFYRFHPIPFRGWDFPLFSLKSFTFI